MYRKSDHPIKTILLVEDNKAFRTSVKKVLEREHYAILEAGSGEEGLDIAQTKKADLIIMDFYLGDMTGDEFLNALPASAPPAIVLSANASDTMEKGVLSQGAKLCLAKPISRENLLNAVKNCICKRKGDEEHAD